MKCISKWISRYVVEKTHPSIRDGNYISKWICGYAVEPSFRDGNDISKWIYADTWIPTGSLENSGYTDTQRIHSGKH